MKISHNEISTPKSRFAPMRHTQITHRDEQTSPRDEEISPTKNYPATKINRTLKAYLYLRNTYKSHAKTKILHFQKLLTHPSNQVNHLYAEHKSYIAMKNFAE